VGEARIEVGGDTAWWVERTFGTKVADGVFATEYSSLPLLASWVLRQDGRAAPQAPDELRREVARGLRLVRERHEGQPIPLANEADGQPEPEAVDRPVAPLPPERFGVLQAMLAYLLDRCGDDSEAEIPAQELLRDFNLKTIEELQEHLSLLNLVNFGGGCYAVYAELDGDTVRVDKELFGDTFRAPPRLTPLEARAIRLALEFVGPMIAADARTPLDRVRAKLEETFGEFELAQTPEPQVQRAEEDLVGTLSRGLRERRLVEVDYLKEGDEEVSTHLVEPYALERRLPYWYVHTWDRTRDGERSFRLDRMRSARLQRGHFEPREGFDPHEFATRGPPASGTRPRSRAGSSKRARAGSRTVRRWPNARSGARSGSSARSSATAARRSCSSRRSCAARSPSARRPCSGSWASPASASPSVSSGPAAPG
jgi:proteasome accessory factor C